MTQASSEHSTSSSLELVFAPPRFFDPESGYLSPLPPRRLELFHDKSAHFRGNYRRFLLFFFGGLFLFAPLLFILLTTLRIPLPLQWTLITSLVITIAGCIVFYSGFHKRRHVALDDGGISYKDEFRSFYFSWQELASIHLHAVEAFYNPYPLCYVRVVTTHGQEFAFANYGNYFFRKQRRVSFGNPPYPIIDIRDADLLLLLLLENAPDKEAVPDLKRLRFRALSESEEEENANDTSTDTNEGEDSVFPTGLGALALLAKFGFNLLTTLPKVMVTLLKTVKPSYVGVSFGFYAIFLNWKYALLLCIILIVHELGHAWTMYRAGMRIKGVYLIPFFGAATVTEDAWPSWYTQAHVHLAGPLWGFFFALLCLLLYLGTSQNLWLVGALWGALINMLNLLPVHPLDGGRILSAMAHSLRSKAGFVFALLCLTAGMVFSIYQALLLLFLLCLVGGLEFFREVVNQQRANKFRLLQERNELGHRELLLVKSITGINLGDRNHPDTLEREQHLFKRLNMLVTAPRMTSWQIVKIGLASVFLMVGFLFFLIIIREVQPSASWALEVFR